MTITPERLNLLDSITLDEGAHSSFTDGHCFNEAVAWLAGEAHSDAPRCVSPVLRRYTMRLNDRWDNEKRQLLKPYLTRVIGTAGDGQDEARAKIAAEYLGTRLMAPWLELADMGDRIPDLEAAKPGVELRDLLWKIRTEAWRKRDAARAELKAKIVERLKDQPADAVADAVADVAADVAAAAVAAAAVDAAAVADVAVAAAAVAVAAAVAAAVVAAVAAKPSWESTYSAAYRAARQYYREHPLPVMAQVEELAVKQVPVALELLDAMIDPAGAK